MQTIGKNINFEIEYKNEDILLSEIGSNIAETNLNANIKITSLIIGAIIVAKIKIKPVVPIAFLIKKLLASIKSKPSDKYPPSSGI